MTDLPTYPKRPPFYAMKIIRAAVKACVANEYGPQVFTILATVAATEDSAKYQRAVTYWDSQLMPLIGVLSQDALARVRARAVRSGWLHYEPGRKGIPGRYWTTIPTSAEPFTDAPVDENPDEFVAGSCAPGVRTTPRHNRDESATEAGSKCGPFLPIPKEEEAANRSGSLPAPGGEKTKTKKSAKTKPDASTVPIPSKLDTPSFREVWGFWLADRKERGKPMTARAAEMQFRKLLKLDAANAVACVEKSIAAGWSDVFEEKFLPGDADHSRKSSNPHPGYDPPASSEVAPPMVLGGKAGAA